MDEDKKVRCVRCLGFFDISECVDVHITMCIGHKQYPHNPVWMCKKCLNDAIEDIKNEFWEGVVYES